MFLLKSRLLTLFHNLSERDTRCNLNWAPSDLDDRSILSRLFYRNFITGTSNRLTSFYELLLKVTRASRALIFRSARKSISVGVLASISITKV